MYKQFVYTLYIYIYIYIIAKAQPAPADFKVGGAVAEKDRDTYVVLPSWRARASRPLSRRRFSRTRTPGPDIVQACRNENEYLSTENGCMPVVYPRILDSGIYLNDCVDKRSGRCS